MHNLHMHATTRCISSQYLCAHFVFFLFRVLGSCQTPYCLHSHYHIQAKGRERLEKMTEKVFSSNIIIYKTFQPWSTWNLVIAI